jgi:hypothetical protein
MQLCSQRVYLAHAAPRHNRNLKIMFWGCWSPHGVADLAAPSCHRYPILENGRKPNYIDINLFDQPSEDCDVLFPPNAPNPSPLLLRVRSLIILLFVFAGYRIWRRAISDSAGALLRCADELSWNGNWFSAAPFYQQAEINTRLKGTEPKRFMHRWVKSPSAPNPSVLQTRSTPSPGTSAKQRQPMRTTAQLSTMGLGLLGRCIAVGKRQAGDLESLIDPACSMRYPEDSPRAANLSRL